MLIPLSEIFICCSDQKKYPKEALLQLEIKTEFVHQLAQHLNLLYLEDVSTENNLCYAYYGDLNSDYKLTLSKSDIRNYLKANLQSKEYDIETGTVKFSEFLKL